MHSLNANTRTEELETGRPTYLFNNWRKHGQQVANLAWDIAREMGLPNGSAARVEKAARYHDIGKSRLPNLFGEFEDQPEALSRSERELLMSHTWLGYRILQSGPDPDPWVAECALLHHEWWNGNGYPLGLVRSDIPLVARIVAVADAYSTLLARRPHPGAWHVEEVLATVRSEAGARFDPECVDALAAVAGRSSSFMTAPDSAEGFTMN